jgi:predicted outer membrane repeat protein
MQRVGGGCLVAAAAILIMASAFMVLDGSGNGSDTASAEVYYPTTATDETSLVSALLDIDSNPVYSSCDALVIESPSPIQLTSALQVNRPLTLKSVNGVTIYSANNTRHIVVGAGSDIGSITLTFDKVTLDGHVVTSGNTSGGGVVYMEAAGQANAPNNTTTVPYSTFTLTIAGANIVNCKTSHSDNYTFYIWYDATRILRANICNLGAVASTGNITVIDSSITNNSVVSGVFSSGGKGSAGGAIASNNDVTIANSNISYNYVEHAGGYTAAGGMDGIAGAIYARDDVTVTNSTINNNAACRGGAIVSNTGWRSGVVHTDADSAAVSSADGVIKIVDSQLNNNRSSNWGSVIFSQDPLSTTYPLLAGSIVVLDGDNEISNNYAAYWGGAIWGSLVYVRGAITADNNVSTGETGAGAYGYGRAAFIDAYYVFMEITDDSSISFNSIGGAVDNNRATAILAARQLAIGVSSGTLAVKGNGKVAAQAYGPANGTFVIGTSIYSLDSIISTTGSGKIVFSENITSSHGGALYSYIKPLTLAGDITFEGNQSKSGGAVYSGAGLVILKNSGGKAPRFIDNVATLYGGAIYSDGEGLVAMSVTGGDITISDAYFGSNRSTDASSRGGAIYVDTTVDGAVSIKRSDFESNTAVASGGAIYVLAPTAPTASYAFTVESSTFEENKANYGGAIRTSSPDAVITDTDFDGNEGGISGGAVYNAGTLALSGTVGRNSFTENSGVYGGAVYNNATLNVTGTDFTENLSAVGGAILNMSAGTTTVGSSAFTDNEATSANTATTVPYNTSGGAIFTSLYANLTINAGVTFSGNTAPVTYSAPIPATADVDADSDPDITTYASKVTPGNPAFSSLYSTIYNNADVNYTIAGSAVLRVSKAVSSSDVTSTTQQFGFSYVQVDDSTGTAYSGGGTPLTGTASTGGNSIAVGSPYTLTFIAIYNLSASTDYYFKITETVPGTLPAGWAYDANASSGYVVEVSVDAVQNTTYTGVYNNTTNIPTFTNSYSTSSSPPIAPPTPTIIYTITSTSDSGSEIDPEGSTSVAGGDDATFTFRASRGYAITSVAVDGVSLSRSEADSGTYTFTNVNSNHAIDVRSDAGTGNGGSDDGEWSPPNLILAIIALVAGLIAVAVGRGRSREGDGERSSKLAWALRTVALVVGIAAVILFFLTEDWTQPVAPYDEWTVLTFVLFFASVIPAMLSWRFDEPNEDDE